MQFYPCESKSSKGCGDGTHDPKGQKQSWMHKARQQLVALVKNQRYPSALTSVLAGCLPSPLNGLINSSWFLDGLDFIVSHSPLSSCSSLILNVILSDFNMSAFSEHAAFDYIELGWQSPEQQQQQQQHRASEIFKGSIPAVLGKHHRRGTEMGGTLQREPPLLSA
ncbi:hypothetical protein Q8A73_010610 [Channa argus]|nr:hypothetical protein Q8A73_010610 [Channa argus]